MKKKMLVLISVILATTWIVACGDDDDSSGSGDDDQSDYQIDTNAIDTTPSGDTGTLAGGDTGTGTGSDTGSESDAGDTEPEQLTANPCVQANYPWDCRPATNEGCTGDEGCDWLLGENDIYSFACVGNDKVAAGEDCDRVEGPFCAAGMTCVAPLGSGKDVTAGTCQRFCCSSADCDADTDFPDCTQPDPYWNFVSGAQLGVCL